MTTPLIKIQDSVLVLNFMGATTMVPLEMGGRVGSMLLTWKKCLVGRWASGAPACLGYFFCPNKAYYILKLPETPSLVC